MYREISHWQRQQKEEEEEEGGNPCRHGEEPSYLHTVRYGIDRGGDLLLLHFQVSDGWTPELFQNVALQIIHHLLSSISTSPSMRIATMAIAAAAAATAVAVSVIAQSVVASLCSAFAPSVHTSAHLANLDAALSTRTMNPPLGGPLEAPFRLLLQLHAK